MEPKYHPILFIGATTSLRGGVQPGSGPIVLSDVRCSGSENKLLQCANNGPEAGSCSHSEDAGVMCSPGNSI